MVLPATAPSSPPPLASPKPLPQLPLLLRPTSATTDPSDPSDPSHPPPTPYRLPPPSPMTVDPSLRASWGSRTGSSAAPTAADRASRPSVEADERQHGDSPQPGPSRPASPGSPSRTTAPVGGWDAGGGSRDRPVSPVLQLALEAPLERPSTSSEPHDGEGGPAGASLPVRRSYQEPAQSPASDSHLDIVNVIGELPDSGRRLRTTSTNAGSCDDNSMMGGAAATDGPGSATDHAKVRGMQSREPLLLPTTVEEKEKPETPRKSRYSLDVVRQRLSGGSPRLSPVARANSPYFAPQDPEKSLSLRRDLSNPSLRSVPIRTTSGRKVKRYRQHGGQNRFFCGGRLVMSADSPLPFLLSTVLVVGIPAAFFYLQARWLWNDLSGGKAVLILFAYDCCIMWSSMYTTAWRDPGIVPRSLDPGPETEWIDFESVNGLRGGGEERVKPRYVRIRWQTVATKWCETCGTYRPPRTSHCRLCGNCIELSDHHCTFINNCIGRRNYLPFLGFLFSASIGLFAVVAISAAHLGLDWTDKGGGEAWTHNGQHIGMLAIGALALLLCGPVVGLLTFHIRLLAHNRTTIETLRPKASQKEQAALHSLGSAWANALAVACRPDSIPAAVQFSGWATKDARTHWTEGEG